MALRHIIQTCTSSFLQTKREFLSVLRLGRVLDLKSKVRLSFWPKYFKYLQIKRLQWLVYRKECRVERWILLLLTGEGRLVSPCRSSIDLLHGVSTEASPLALSAASPSKLKRVNHGVKKITDEPLYPESTQANRWSVWYKKSGQKKNSRNSILCEG